MRHTEIMKNIVLDYDTSIFPKLSKRYQGRSQTFDRGGGGIEKAIENF